MGLRPARFGSRGRLGSRLVRSTSSSCTRRFSILNARPIAEPVARVRLLLRHYVGIDGWRQRSALSLVDKFGRARTCLHGCCLVAKSSHSQKGGSITTRYDAEGVVWLGTSQCPFVKTIFARAASSNALSSRRSNVGSRWCLVGPRVPYNGGWQGRQGLCWRGFRLFRQVDAGNRALISHFRHPNYSACTPTGQVTQLLFSQAFASMI